jgi:hypothetical protein
MLGKAARTQTKDRRKNRRNMLGKAARTQTKDRRKKQTELNQQKTDGKSKLKYRQRI